VCGWQVKLCDPWLTRAISEHFRDEVLYEHIYYIYYFYNKVLYKLTLLSHFTLHTCIMVLPLPFNYPPPEADLPEFYH